MGGAKLVAWKENFCGVLERLCVSPLGVAGLKERDEETFWFGFLKTTFFEIFFVTLFFAKIIFFEIFFETLLSVKIFCVENLIVFLLLFVCFKLLVCCVCCFCCVLFLGWFVDS